MDAGSVSSPRQILRRSLDVHGTGRAPAPGRSPIAIAPEGEAPAETSPHGSGSAGASPSGTRRCHQTVVAGLAAPRRPICNLQSTICNLLWLLLALGASQAGAAQITRSSGTEIRVEGLPRDLAPGVFLQVFGVEEPCGYLQAEEVKGRNARCRLVAGAAPPGADVRPILPEPVRLALLTDEPGGAAAAELRALFPGGVTLLGPEGRGLDPARFDAAVSVLYRRESLAPFRFAAMAAFAAAGRPAFMGLAEYASRRGVVVQEYRGSEPPPTVRCAREHPMLAGLAVGDELSWYGREGAGYVQRRLAGLPEGTAPLLASTGPDGGAVAALEEVGERGGFIAAVDLASPNGQPGFDAGAKWKWLPVGNATRRSIRFARDLPKRLPYGEFVAHVEELAKRFPERLALEHPGSDASGTPILALRLGDPARPTFLIQACIHGAEWVNAYAALRLAEVLATPQWDPRPAWLLRHFSVLIVPLMNPSGYTQGTQPSASGCDLDYNFDYNWDLLTHKPPQEWRGQIPMEKLKGPRPWSEPEARLLRNLLTRNPIIGYMALHMHGYEHGWCMIQPSAAASHDLALLDDAAALINARLRGRLLWGGNRQLSLRAGPWMDEPTSYNWASVRRIPSCVFETIGGGEEAAVITEVAHEACLGFMEVVGARVLAHPLPWAEARRREIERPAGRADLIAYLLGENGNHRVAYWRHRGSGTLRLPIPLNAFIVRDAGGDTVPISRTDAGLHVPVGDPLVLDCGSARTEEVVSAFQEAQLLPAPRQVLWIPADAARLTGRMGHASRLKLKDPGALSDFIVCTGLPNRERPEPWYAEYAVNVPVTDTYTVWARLRYPSGRDDSFTVVTWGARVTADPGLALGNSGQGISEWHWDSQGSGETSRPGSGRRQVYLTRGRSLLRVYAREGPGTAQLNPRLDILCLTNDESYTPCDADVPDAARRR